MCQSSERTQTEGQYWEIYEPGPCTPEWVGPDLFTFKTFCILKLIFYGFTYFLKNIFYF